jgi:hypothetical protein
MSRDDMTPNHDQPCEEDDDCTSPSERGLVILTRKSKGELLEEVLSLRRRLKEYDSVSMKMKEQPLSSSSRSNNTSGEKKFAISSEESNNSNINSNVDYCSGLDSVVEMISLESETGATMGRESGSRNLYSLDEESSLQFSSAADTIENC